jgi:tRNA(Arg) A34 adenosine deaminase TadA
MKDDKYFLQEAVKIGKKGYDTGITPVEFGAVVVKDGKIIARDHSHTHQNHDPTAHAEASSIKQAGHQLKTHNLEGCTLYCSHEPCFMCFSCAAWARMDRVVYASPASGVDGTTYEFEGVSLEDMAKKLARRPIKVELIRL